MPALPADRSGRSRNPLVLPVIVLSVVAVAEGVALAFLLAAVLRPSARAVVAAQSTEAGGSSRTSSLVSLPQTAPAPIPTPREASAVARETAAAPAPARGKVRQRVDSAGFGITVEKILHEPATYKDMVSVGADEHYLAFLVVADNKTGHNAQLFPSQFRLQDKEGFGYDPLGIKGTMPALEWRTLGNRESVRGYVDFVVPKSAKGLTLIYAGVPEGGAPVYVEVGE